MNTSYSLVVVHDGYMIQCVITHITIITRLVFKCSFPPHLIVPTPTQTFSMAERFRLNHRAALLLRQASLTVSLPLTTMVVLLAPLSTAALSRACMLAAATLVAAGVAARVMTAPGTRVCGGMWGVCVDLLVVGVPYAWY